MIFPNPSNGIFTIQPVNTDIDGEGYIYDNSGRLVTTVEFKGNNPTQVDLSNRESGVYTLTIVTSFGQKNVRLLLH